MDGSVGLYCGSLMRLSNVDLHWGSSLRLSTEDPLKPFAEHLHRMFSTYSLLSCSGPEGDAESFFFNPKRCLRLPRIAGAQFGEQVLFSNSPICRLGRLTMFTHILTAEAR